MASTLLGRTIGWRSVRASTSPRYSPTTAPTTLNTAAVFRPAKMNGSAVGNFSFTSVCQRLAPIDRNSITVSRSVAARPAAVSTITGKNAMNSAITTFELMPKPSQATNTGAKATFGRALKPTR